MILLESAQNLRSLSPGRNVHLWLESWKHIYKMKYSKLPVRGSRTGPPPEVAAPESLGRLPSFRPMKSVLLVDALPIP